MTTAPIADDESLVGHYAGAVTRFGAFVVDALLSVGVFNIGVAALSWILSLFTGIDLPTRDAAGWWSLPLAAWLFVYFWYCYSLAGKTPGKAFFGLRVVRGDGGDVDGGHAALRVLAFPLSWIPFGLGFAGIVVGRRRRALHDVVADTAVVYDFDARAAHLRFLSRHAQRRSPLPGEAAPDAAAQHSR